jgi:hypothetical protein
VTPLWELELQIPHHALCVMLKHSGGLVPISAVGTPTCRNVRLALGFSQLVHVIIALSQFPLETSSSRRTTLLTYLTESTYMPDDVYESRYELYDLFQTRHRKNSCRTLGGYSNLSAPSIKSEHRADQTGRFRGF